MLVYFNGRACSNKGALTPIRKKRAKVEFGFCDFAFCDFACDFRFCDCEWLVFLFLFFFLFFLVPGQSLEWAASGFRLPASLCGLNLECLCLSRSFCSLTLTAVSPA